jgi:SAM-dependent methyltransferase
VYPPYLGTRPPKLNQMTDQTSDPAEVRRMLNSIADEVIKMRQEVPIPTNGPGLAHDSLIRDTERLLSTVGNPATQVGRMPPQPPTLRARLGSVLVKLVRRSLFWYSAQVNEANARIAQTLRGHAERISKIAKIVDQTRLEFLKQFDADAMVMRQVEQDTSEIRRMADHSAAQLRNLSADLSTTQHDMAELSISVHSLNKGVHDMRAAVQHDIAAAMDKALTRERTARAEMESALEADRMVRAEMVRAEMESALEMARTAIRSDMERTRDAIQNLERLVQQTRITLQVQDGRISLLMRERREARGNGAAAPLPAPPATVTAGELGPLYVEFENTFRGTRAEIKQRVAAHLRRVAKNNVGMPQMPVLDVGCGRGEWLEVLAESGLVGIGVDSNEACVAECRDRGLTAELSDGIEYLRRRPSESQGAVTAFHVVEHLPFGLILDLLDEALRTLKTGGILILETPNPANLIVGAHTFYLDPTHVRPLPADLLRFLVESRGFCNIEVVPLHPFPDHHRLEDTENAAAVLLNDLVYGARDYAIIAERP